MSFADVEFASLADFQRDSVEYVLSRFHGKEPTRRFLVADEVGMGKTHVARGVIAGTIDELRKPENHIERIDVLYICSNASIARQNIAKLDVLGEGTRPLSTRITLLATQLHDLNRPREDGEKIVNLIAFTPGTSFQKGHAPGRVEERALLYALSKSLFNGRSRRKALSTFLRGGVRASTWRWEVHNVDSDWADEPDPEIKKEYLRLVRESEVHKELRWAVNKTQGRSKPLAEVSAEHGRIVGTLRHLLARASVQALEPDLVILDEFQRFRHLLEEPEKGPEAEISQLAHDLFTYDEARVLLLSATPYKMLTLPEEGEDHYKDFLATVQFLAFPNGEKTVGSLGADLAEFRDRLLAGADPLPARDRAQQTLRSLMCRTERPIGGEGSILRQRYGDIESPQAEDLVAFAEMKSLATLVEGSLSVDYWKSAPYFLNFMDGYQLSRRVEDHVARPDVRELVRRTPRVERDKVSARQPIEPANSRLRALKSEVIDSGLVKLLWLPPSMPYHKSGEPFAGVDASKATKRLIFSSWAAAPSSIAAVLSHEALRQLLPESTDPAPPRLTYPLGDGRPERMTTLLLTIPLPGLAEASDPLTVAKRDIERTPTAHEVITATTADIGPEIPGASVATSRLSRDTWYWYAPLTRDGHPENYADLRQAVTALSDDATSKGLAAHLELADDAVAGEVTVGAQPSDLTQWVAMVGLASPANCAWRALRRVLGTDGSFSDEAIVGAAATIAEGFRRLFNRPEVINLLDSLGHTRMPYWQQVLEYCFAGNLQAVLDEYLHHLIDSEKPSTDDDLEHVACSVADVVSFGLGRVQAFDPLDPEEPIRFNTRFALRFGNARGNLAKDDQAATRASDVQAAFNSPFWPFVLASTSVGQEGVDFHRWCHSLIHWNQPANVVDLEQREGRVNRYRGHAVRKNVGAAHRAEALQATEPDPWEAAFRAAESTRPKGLNDLWPSWVYPGAFDVDCWVPYFPLSKDIERQRRLREQRGLYRLAFGQPRQEDLLTLLSTENSESLRLDDLRIDLSPPSRP
ncbi:MAG: hypothetical protein ACK5O2_16280 [Microthrixaceae bacterium]